MSRPRSQSSALLLLAFALFAAPTSAQETTAARIAISANGRDANVAGCLAPCSGHFSAALFSTHPSANLYLDLDYAWNFGEGSNPRRWGETTSRATDYIGECNAPPQLPVG